MSKQIKGSADADYGLNKNRDYIDSMPHEILIKVFSYLHFKDWAKLQVISKHWRQLLSSDHLWGNAFFWWELPQVNHDVRYGDNVSRKQFKGKLAIEEVSGTKPMSLAFYGASNPVKSAKKAGGIKNIDSYYHLAKLSCFYPVAQLKSIASVDENSLNYFQVRKFVKQTSLCRLSSKHRDKRRIVLLTTQSYFFELQNVSEELRADKEVVLAAVAHHGYALKHASVKLRADKEVVLAAVAVYGSALEYASAELQKDRDVVLTAVMQEAYIIQFSPIFKDNIAFLMEAKGKNPNILCYLSQETIERVARAERVRALYHESAVPGLQ